MPLFEEFLQKKDFQRGIHHPLQLLLFFFFAILKPLKLSNGEFSPLTYLVAKSDLY